MVKNAAAIASMVVHIGLDKTEMTQGLTAMKNTVRAATAEWKTQFSVFNQLGDHVKAAETKYKGLTTAIEAQEKVIDQERSQLSNLGARTKDNADAYDKLSSQINQNANKLAGLTLQQEKARKMYEYEQSGIRGNKEELSLLQKEMQSTVNMYKAQGESEKANAAQAKGLHEQIKQLEEMQSKERSILEKVKSEAGENSRAYREQAIRVNELSGKLGHARTELENVGKSADESAGRFSRLGKAAHTFSDTFKGSFLGSMAGNLITSTFSRISGGMHDIISTGIGENKTLEQINSQWGQMTKSAKTGEEMTKIIENMHNASHYSLGTVSALNKAMFGLTGNKKGMESLSTSIQEVGRAKGLDESKILMLSKRLQQVGNTGKVTYSDVSKMNKALPGFAAAMAQNMGVSADKLVEMGRKGKLTSKDFQNTMNTMGKNNADSFNKYNHTWQGGMDVIHDTWDKLAGTLMKPVFNGKRSGLTEFAKYMNGKDVQRGAKDIGKAISSMVSEAMKDLAQMAKWVSGHKKEIGGFLTTIKDTVGDVWKAAKPVLTFLLEHPKILIGAASGLLAISGAMKGVSIGMQIASLATKGFSKALISSGIGAAVVLLGIGAVELISHWKQVKKFFGGLGGWFKGVWNGITSGVSHFVSGVGSHFNNMRKSVGSHVSKLASGVKDKFGDARKWAVSATNKMADQVSDKHSWLNKQTNGAASTMFKGLKKTYKSGHKTMESATDTFRDLIHGKWSKLGGDIKKTAKNAMNTAHDYFRTGYNTLNKLTGGRLGDMFDKVKSIGGKIVNFFKKLPGRMADGIRNGWHAIESAFVHLGNGMLSGIGKGVNGVIKGIDWILKKVNAPTIKPWKVPQYALGGLAQGLAIVGEKKKHELIKYPDGRMELSPNTATLYNFKQPVKILGGDKTESLLKSIPKFSLGTWLGSAVDFVKGGFSKIADGAEGFWNAITHPKQLLNTAIDKFTDLSGLNGTVLDMAQGTVKTVASEALGWLKKKLALVGNPPGGNVDRWKPYVSRALGMVGLPTSSAYVNAWMRQIKTESGGNPKAVQHGYTDINTIRGDLAKGLLQTISATFNAYKMPGHGNIFNGLDNMLAAMRYAKSRYGISGMLGVIGHGHGYKDGGFVAREQIARLAEGNKPEMVVPLTDKNKFIQRMYQALTYFMDNNGMGNTQPPKQTTTDNSQLMLLIAQTNQLVAQLIQVVQDKPTGITQEQVYDANKKVTDRLSRNRNLAMGVVNP
jgi:tape measure domain-containing protein